MQITLYPVSVGKTLRYIPYNTNKKLHWAARYRWNVAWQEEVKWTIYENRKKFGKLPMPFCKLKIVLHTIREQDKDNVYASVKPIIDALKMEHAGVIVDDDNKHLDLTVEQVKVDKVKEQKVVLYFS